MKINSVKPGVPKKATYLSLIAVVLFLAWLKLHKECVAIPHIRHGRPVPATAVHPTQER